MPQSLSRLLLFLFISFSFACNREKVNIEGRWEIVQTKIPKGNAGAGKDSVSQLLPHFMVGNKLDFTGGELTVNRKGADDSTYYGFASYKVAKDGRSIMIDAGKYKPLKFQLRYRDEDRVELRNKRQNIKVLLKPYEED
jgi:hypothetical protein